MEGKVQVYTGSGKGKTTSALGLALRAVGAGMKVFIGQFVKGQKYSELKSLEKIDEITVKQFGLKYFIKGSPEAEDVKAAREGLKEIKQILKSGKYELVILDEANIATLYDLYSVEELMEVVKSRDEKVEVVITGRGADEKVIEEADLVTEMKEVKHYFQNGVTARRGIEN